MFKIIATTLILAISTFGLISTNAQSTQPKPNNDAKRSQGCETRKGIRIQTYNAFVATRQAQLNSTSTLQNAVINALQGKADITKLNSNRDTTKSLGDAEIVEMNKKLEIIKNLDCSTQASRKDGNNKVKAQHTVIVDARSKVKASKQAFQTVSKDLLKAI